MLLTNSNTAKVKAFLALLVMKDHKHKIKSLNLNNTKTSGQLGNKGKMGKGHGDEGKIRQGTQNTDILNFRFK